MLPSSSIYLAVSYILVDFQELYLSQTKVLTPENITFA